METNISKKGPVAKIATVTTETNEEEIPEDFRHLPRDVGWILLFSGLLSEVGMPGVPPFWIAGIMILWPETGYRLTRPLQKRFPKAYKQSIKMVSRYVSDLERRFPPRSEN